ncbi:MAG: hypothetical protein E7E23_02265 [Paenibacillus sp.]|uniref:hypothetical protein n=1 Tax=Paenibacillus sp. TaxID=58172 RepID=UPI0028FF3323|nr:hypothetical protein [Paenibacillus sp.]MDU2239375.1 hypothetical protein [Paenibacillus sp.]
MFVLAASDGAKRFDVETSFRSVTIRANVSFTDRTSTEERKGQALLCGSERATPERHTAIIDIYHAQAGGRLNPV